MMMRIYLLELFDADEAEIPHFASEISLEGDFVRSVPPS